MADDNPSIVRTPLVIAMWEPLARALGWPRKPVGFQQILDLALDPRGWAAYGKPQFGRFKLGHTNPDFSTSGLSAVAAEYYSATGKREGLTEADIRKPKVRREIKAIERSIVHYGDTTLFFSDQLKRFGPALRLGGRDGGGHAGGLQPQPARRQARRASTRPRARSSPTTPSSCSARRG